MARDAVLGSGGIVSRRLRALEVVVLRIVHDDERIARVLVDAVHYRAQRWDAERQQQQARRMADDALTQAQEAAHAAQRIYRDGTASSS